MTLDQVRVAQLSDLEGVVALYKTVCDHQSLDKYGAKWTWGEYPSVDGLRDFIQQATVVVGGSLPARIGRCHATKKDQFSFNY